MAALKKTAEKMAASEPQPRLSSPRIEMATTKSPPVVSAAQQLRLQLEAALNAPRDRIALNESELERWSPQRRLAILAGAIFLPWSFIAVTVWAIVR